MNYTAEEEMLITLVECALEKKPPLTRAVDLVYAHHTDTSKRGSTMAFPRKMVLLTAQDNSLENGPWFVSSGNEYWERSDVPFRTGDRFFLVNDPFRVAYECNGNLFHAVYPTVGTK